MFFITGLPRSGTAWFANLLTNRDTYCFHEPMIIYENFNRELYKKEMTYHHIGISDSSLLTYYKDWIEPEDPMLIVLREPSEVRDSLNNLFGFDTTGMVEKMCEMIQKINHDNIKTIKYKDLQDLSKIQEVCSFLLEESWMDPDRIKFLQSCNVQRDERYINKINDLIEEITGGV